MTIQTKSQSILRSSDVVRTLTDPCFFNILSSDHKGQFNFNARAKYSISPESGQILEAFFSNSLKFMGGTNSMFKEIKDKREFISEIERLDLKDTSFLYFSISSNKNSGAYNFNFSEKISSAVLPEKEINDEITSFASITNSIQDLDKSVLYLLCKEAFIFFPISKASFFVSFDFDTIDLKSKSCESLFLMDSLATSDQLISSNSSIWFFNSSGIDKVIVGIFCPQIFNTHNIVNIFKVFKPFERVQK